MKKEILIILILGSAAGYIAGYYIGYDHGWEKRYPPNVFCTDEAKLCPDGSTVGRMPPDCKFAKCPGNEPAGPTGIQGQVVYIPKCSQPPEITCAPNEPYQTDLVLTDETGENVIQEFQSDENGKYSLLVDPGGYTIRSADSVNDSPYCTSFSSFLVSPGKIADIRVSCDANIP